MRPSGIILPAVLGIGFAGVALRDEVPLVRPNDNTVAAGRMVGDTLRLDLEVRRATWYPESDGGQSVVVEAFSEAGKAPQIPGPLIRVREGTIIEATLRNALPDSGVRFSGLVTRPAGQDSGVRLGPGERRTVRFAAGAPGTYFYSARMDQPTDAPPGGDGPEREQLAGAFIVDPAAGSPPDRVLVLNIWGEAVGTDGYRNALAINGKSWPHTERFRATVGDSIRWRVINPTVRDHPMHLHGVYFRVDSRGSGGRDSVFADAHRRLAVTEEMLPGTTMTMVWRPDRPGNWLFHCHLMFHAVQTARLDVKDHEGHSSDAGRHMAGLVVGIAVDPRPDEPVEARPNPRQLRLVAQEGPRRGRAERSLSFILQRDATAPAPDSVENPGSVLVLTRDQPTDITVVNRLKEPTAVHWHGIELESWSDGVAGWSGIGTRVAPAIAPGDSFTARLTLPRAGTFMYHTHLNDIDQVTSGLYGPIVVLEPGQRWDPETDHVMLVSWDSPGEPAQILVNGDSLPRVKHLRADATHRFRFINIGPAAAPRFVLRRDTTQLEWRRVAKDGADLPPAQQRVTRGLRLNVGEIHDVEWRPPAPGEYTLSFGPRQGRYRVLYQLLVR